MIVNTEIADICVSNEIYVVGFQISQQIAVQQSLQPAVLPSKSVSQQISLPFHVYHSNFPCKNLSREMAQNNHYHASPAHETCLMHSHKVNSVNYVKVALNCVLKSTLGLT